jgi:Ca2+/Na+ antiporter
MNLKDFFSFQVNTAFVSPQEKLLLLAGGVAFLLSIIFRIAASVAPNPFDKDFRHQLYRVFMFFGVGEMLWYLFRWQNIVFFGSHFMASLIALISVVWLVWVVVVFIKNYATKKEDWEKEQQKLKYLPK